MTTPTTTATLVYTVAPSGIVSLGRLNTAVEFVDLQSEALQEIAGCTQVSDNTTTSGGTVVRTVVMGLVYPIAKQFNGNHALPLNSTQKQFYVVTTTGPNGTIGQTLYDDGSDNDEPVTVYAAVTGQQIVTLTALTGGAITFLAGHLYTQNMGVWSDGGASSIGANAFQSSFPPGSDQAKPFNSVFQHTLGANLGAAVAASPVVIT
jgi:hypothetical protein